MQGQRRGQEAARVYRTRDQGPVGAGGGNDLICAQLDATGRKFPLTRELTC